jgi:hypothetical protein
VELEGTVNGAPVSTTLRRIPYERYSFYDPRWWQLR